MIRSPEMADLRRWTAAASLAALATCAGCAGDSAGPTTPRTDPPTGGEIFLLDFDAYVTRVAPVLSTSGCAAAGDCHGGGIRGTFELSPEDAKDHAFDFQQVVLQVAPYTPDASPILTKPLASDAGGEPHAFEPFPSTDDDGYRAIADWIHEGVFE